MMALIPIVLKILGFLLDWKSASDDSKKAFIALSAKLSQEGKLPVNVHDKMKSKWDKINQQIEDDKHEQTKDN